MALVAQGICTLAGGANRDVGNGAERALVRGNGGVSIQDLQVFNPGVLHPAHVDGIVARFLQPGTPTGVSRLLQGRRGCDDAMQGVPQPAKVMHHTVQSGNFSAHLEVASVRGLLELDRHV